MDMIEGFYIGVPGAIRSTEFAVPSVVSAPNSGLRLSHIAVIDFRAIRKFVFLDLF
jgi:hypothetical protein